MLDTSAQNLTRVNAVKAASKVPLDKLFATIWRDKLWIILAAVIGLMLGIWYAYFAATPLYTSGTVVALESRQQQVMDIENVVTGLSGDQATINTEVEVIRSRDLFERLLDELNLVNDPEFNRDLQPEPFFSVGKAIKFVRQDLLGQEVIPTEVIASELNDIAVRNEVIDVLLTRLKVSNVRQSRVFKISVTTQDPHKSALIANTLTQLYINDQVRVKFEKTDQATQWLTERVTDLQIELEEAEEALKQFSSNTNLVSPENQIALNRQVKDLRGRRDDLQRQVEAMSDEDSAAFVRLQGQIAGLSQTIEQSVARIDVQSNELVKLQQLQREAEASRLIYEAFLGRLKETSIQQGIQQADSRILSTAVPPVAPVSPKKKLILAFSLILGGLLGTGLVLLREKLQTTFRDAEDVESRTSYTVLGQIPMIPARRRKDVLKYLTEKPNSAAAEAIRNLRTSLLLAKLDKNPQIIMSTSSIPGEGKTTQSLALAHNFAGLGERVLLIEGDIRRRVFKDYFQIPTVKGFLSVLSGDAELDEAIVKVEKLNADILVGEKSSVNAADLYSSEKFALFLNQLREKYDRIIIDTPPVLAVPDARVIGQLVDATIYTVKWDDTSHRQVLSGIKSLETVNAEISGLVLSQINKRKMKRYGFGDSYGDYQSYYES